MKKLLLLMSIMCSVNIHAQDVIVKKDGSTILSKVLEVNTLDIKYKKFSNQNGPTYTLNKSEILAINYENGEKDSFTNYNNKEDEKEEKKGYVEMKADINNYSIIDMYNRIYQPSEKVKVKDKPSWGCIVIFGIETSSVMSNEEIEMKIIREKQKNADGIKEDCYYINLKNKTDRTIYIDKGNCFRLNKNGDTFCFFNNEEQTTVSKGGETGASINIGSVTGALGVGGTLGQIASGINVGGGNSHSISTTYLQKRIIAIPPRGNINLTRDKWVKTKEGNIIIDAEYKSIENSERFYIEKETDSKSIGLTRGVVNRGQVLTFKEGDLNWKREYFVTYSKDENFQSYSVLNARLYIHEIIGCEEYVVDPIELGVHNNSEKCIDGINEYTLNCGLYLQK